MNMSDEYSYALRYFHKGIPTEYFVTYEGDVYSYKHSGCHKMIPTKSANGYIKIKICVGGRIYNRNIHRIVAETFIPNPENKPEVNHIDGNKHNNAVSNLEWTTRKENADHAYTHGLFGKGEELARSSISDAKCREICGLLQDTSLSYNEISQAVHVSKRIVSSIAKRQSWKHISDEYDFSKRKFISFIDEDTVHRICKLLEKKYDVDAISALIGCKQHIVKDIKRGRSWTAISSKYKIL